ncbi:hypothetical protein ETW23_07835 [Leisingera sp. NJS201]|uniref:hypothetical protein n=1 Tax=Leisingera sp. NJS201 TaxID=2508306 RepID=UPI0010712099|nr:hypothetical protein [Leisingera sp. NJS201]QBR36064.1 hypothetical protein ETW23_07835 [Leisingera sp. NJS201]
MSDTDEYQSLVDRGWREFANDEEKQRLAVLDARIDLKRQILAETVKQRADIRRLLLTRRTRSIKSAKGPQNA